MNVPWRRAETLLGAVTLTALSVEFWIQAAEANDDAVAPLIWPVLTGISALLVVGVVVCPRSRTLYIVAITTALTAVATKPFGVIGNYMVGYTKNGISVWIAFTVYPSYALLGAVWWFLRVGPWRRRHELRATIQGD